MPTTLKGSRYMATQSSTQAYRVASGEGLAEVWWKTGRVTVKTSGAETQGRFGQVEVDDPLGTAPPLHVHHQDDESFYVVDGEVTVFADGDRIDLSAGDYALVPRGVPHSYLVRSERARLLVTFSPAGFEEFFVEVGMPGNGSDPPAGAVLPAPDEFARRLAPYGCQIVGPPPTLGELER
jgi:quercetin dioxygenase-like cupin family protein